MDGRGYGRVRGRASDPPGELNWTPPELIGFCLSEIGRVLPAFGTTVVGGGGSEGGGIDPRGPGPTCPGPTCPGLQRVTPVISAVALAAEK
jgi:hypothetical protein